MKELSRRNFLSMLAGGSAVTLAPNGPMAWSFPPRSPGAEILPRPTQGQLDWQNFELGILYSFDMPVYAPGGWSWNASKKVMIPRLYNPEKLDMDQWLAASKALGAKYAIFTATHFNGFLQWQSDIYPYGLKQAKWRNGKGDLVKDFVEACHRHNVRPGLFLSCIHNAYWKVWEGRVNWGKGGPGQAKFARICEQMVEELCSRYGPLAEIWFDAGLLTPDEGGPNVLPIVEKYQPNTVFYHSAQRADHRWIGNENGLAGYPCWATMPSPNEVEVAYHKGPRGVIANLLSHGDPEGKSWSPGMVDVPIRDHDWFWVPDHDQKVFPLDRLMEMYYTSVGRNCTFIIGAVPNPHGLVPETDFQRYAELGKEIRRRFGKPISEGRGNGNSVEIVLPRPATIDHVAAMEEIAHGERIREYVIEGFVAGDNWQPLCRGFSIGHKRIQRFSPVEVSRVRLRSTRSVAQPMLRSLAVYSVEAS